METAKIDKNLIQCPQIQFTFRATQEIKLILENDYKLKDYGLRIQINGKKCDGFTYAIGFTRIDIEDFIIDKEFKVVIDPFTAFYVQQAVVDFIQDLENNEEGFILINPKQKAFHGKFWREDSSKIPPLKTATNDSLGQL
ncbi:MAG: iron-sulfur cluster assembly accessory protein [Bacteriovoracaceae bacterium]